MSDMPVNDSPVLFIVRHAQRPATDIGEAWDAVMVCAAFDRRTTVLLSGDAAQLIAADAGVALAAVMATGVEALYVDAVAYVDHAPAPVTNLTFTLVDELATRALINAHPIVITL